MPVLGKRFHKVNCGQARKRSMEKKHSFFARVRGKTIPASEREGPRSCHYRGWELKSLHVNIEVKMKVGV